MNEDKLFLFNPFQLALLSDEQIELEINNIASRFVSNADTPSEIASNIEIYENLKYFYGEMNARYTTRHAIKKYENDKGEGLLAYKLRKEWSKNNLEKAPNYSYFESEAQDKYELSRREEFTLYQWKLRFKNCWDSVEGKANALKKSLEATKYEIGI